MPTGWGEWSPPTECSKECGGGTQIRTRKCHGVAQVGNKCVGGGDQQTLKCNEKPCGGVSGWGEWGSQGSKYFIFEHSNIPFIP